MSKSKQTTTQNTTSNQNYSGTTSYGWMTPPDTADTQALRDFQFQVDPSISNIYSQARNRIANQYASPIGGNYTPQMRDQILRSSYRDLAQQESAAHSSAYNETQGQRFGQRTALASMTAPRLAVTGQSGSSSGTSSGTGAQTQTPSTISTVTDLIGGVSAGVTA